METLHRPIIGDSRSMEGLPDNSIDLVITSPPYPMIEMWDPIFSSFQPKITTLLEKGDGPRAFEAMHKILDPVWKECYRVLKPGRFACINIGDATRTLKEQFSLYTNHARILAVTQKIGFSSLPCILWRKQTNAPNKFMGSGMLPAGAYVTLEHEYILILRKGPKREFNKEADKQSRRESALFWEERNVWFSDVWFDIKGAVQSMGDKTARKRSGAYPFELAHRLINMYSVQGDQVLDPFLGTGTTMAAAMAANRNSVGYELDASLGPGISAMAETVNVTAAQVIRQRLIRHIDFVLERMKTRGPLKHSNRHYGFPVITAQERGLLFKTPMTVTQTLNHHYKVTYDPLPQKEFCKDWSKILASKEAGQLVAAIEKAVTPKKRVVQGELF
ncbi:MAG: site-specific DNA-methyltransferase [Deltaproteobacteria bacterium]|nr:MAG: site-specific DNA-methyltransferase [Deltaproteobacteria bacterium]